MLKFIQNNREATALLAVLLLFVLPGMLDSQYLSVQTLTMIFSSSQILMLLAMGSTLVMLTRNIDVSVGSITGMCAVLLGLLLNAGYPLPVACVATLLLGLLAGFIQPDSPASDLPVAPYPGVLRITPCSVHFPSPFNPGR